MYDASDQRFQSRSVLSNIIWKFLERGSSLIVTLLINIVLARLLDPSSHGLLAMVTVFVTISQIFVTAGVSGALIQKKDADELDFSTVFWLNSGVSLFLYLVLFAISPAVAHYLGYPELSLILRILSLRVFFAGFNSIQQAHISRNMLFRHYFFSTLSAKVLSGILGIILAFVGTGVWALVAQSVSVIMIESLVLWFRVKWRPTRQFSWSRGKALYTFTYKIMLTSFAEIFTDQLRSIIIGCQYTANDLAFYDKGYYFPNAIAANVSVALSNVMYPVLASKQTTLSSVKATCRQWISLGAYLVFPLLAGLAAVAEVLIPLLLTEKWAAAVPFLWIACGTYAAQLIETPIRDAIKSIGNPTVCMYMQFAKAACSLLSLLLVYKQGVYAIAVAALLCAGINILISLACARKYLGYVPKEAAVDLLPTLLLCSLMLIGTLGVAQLISRPFLCLVAQVLAGTVIYIAASLLTRNENFHSCISMLKKFKNHD